MRAYGVRAGQALGRPRAWGLERCRRGPQARAGLGGGRIRRHYLLKPCSSKTRRARSPGTFISVGTSGVAESGADRGRTWGRPGKENPRVHPP